MSDPLRMAVIYDKPTDFPENVVVRCVSVLPGFVRHDEVPLGVVHTVDAARDLCVQFGFDSCISRASTDDAAIVETWL